MNIAIWGYFLLFIVLILAEIPVAFAMLAPSLLYAVLNGDSFMMFAQKTAAAYADFNMLAIPGFLFVGIFMNKLKLTDKIFVMAEKWVGHFLGGLAHANVLASMIFAGMSGSSLADAGGLGAIEVKAMKEAGYDEYFSVAVTAASSTIGPIIPPSINFVVWAFLAQTSTLGMFIGGIIPGLLLGLSMMLFIVIMIKRMKIKVPTVKKSSWKDRLIYTYKALPALGGPIILIGGILTGAFTPTECSVVAAAYLVLVSLLDKSFSFASLFEALQASLISSAMVMALCATGLIFNWMIVTSGFIAQMSSLLLSLGSKSLVLFVLNLILLVMGCFIGNLQMLIMIAPLLMSIALELNLSLIHVGVMAVLAMTISIITPPMAPALFVTAKATGVSFNKSLKYTVFLIIPLYITLMLITYFPKLVLWLPGLLGVV
jgi:tripartite ATP-independent transporter DctM subunit